MSKRFLSALLIGTLLGGCGQTNDTLVGPGEGSGAPPTLPLEIVAAGRLKDPDQALRLAPRSHLDETTRPKTEVSASNTVTNLTVASLELSYDTIFGSLSQQFGVTNSTSQVQSNINYIASQAGTGFFNLNKAPIQNNPAGVTSVLVQPVTYNTTVPLPAGNQTFQVSGGLVMPQGIAQPKGVVVFFHGTTTDNSEVPSQYSNCSEFQLTAEVFGSQGYVVVAPDYVGQGVDFADVHPYVIYPRVSAQTAVDMLNAVQPLLSAQYPQASPQPLKLFSTGYSEGGAYAVWFNSYVSAGSNLSSFYRFTHAIGMEGAYSCSNVTYNFLFDNVGTGSGNPFNIQSGMLVNIAKPVLGADALLAYATYTASANFANVFLDSFFAMTATGGIDQSNCNVNGQQLTIAQAFATTGVDIGKPLLYSGLNKSNNGATYPGEFGLLFSSQNSVNALVSSTLVGTGLSQLQSTLQAADVNLTGVADGSVSLVTLDQDSIVSPNNFQWLQSAYPSKIKNAVTVDHTQLQAVSPFSSGNSPIWENIDHTTALAFEYLYTLNILNSF